MLHRIDAPGSDVGLLPSTLHGRLLHHHVLVSDAKSSSGTRSRHKRPRPSPSPSLEEQRAQWRRDMTCTH
jgi:hypothetical protein